jgi:hypothetical protein
MKKNIALIFFASCCLQGIAQKGWDFGISGTFMNTYIWRQNNYGTLAPFQNAEVRQSEMAYKPTWGGQGGLDVGYNFSRMWGIKIGLQYCATGQNYEDNFEGPATIPEGMFGSTNSTVNVQRNVRLGYIMIPLLARFTTKRGGVARFFVNAGPQIGIRTSAYEQVKIAGYPYLPDSLNFPANEKFQRLDAGLALQFGVDLFVTKHLYFELGLSGYLGITDLNGGVLQKLGWYDKNHVSYQESHNTTVGLTLGIHYIFAKKWNL